MQGNGNAMQCYGKSDAKCIFTNMSCATTVCFTEIS